MNGHSIGIGLIIFGILALGSTIDGSRRKAMTQPDWVAMNWRTVVRGIAGWCIAGAIAIVVGIVCLVV
jgi:hypothetical protein